MRKEGAIGAEPRALLLSHLLLLLSISRPGPCTACEPTEVGCNTKLNFGVGGEGSPRWEYGTGIMGWSHYVRAFNLFLEQPTQEVGWGQWSKPNIFNDAEIVAPPVCGLHPNGFMCPDPDDPGETIEASAVASNCLATHPECADAEDESCPCLNSCGSTDPAVMAGCQYWKCGTVDNGGVTGSIEGWIGRGRSSHFALPFPVPIEILCKREWGGA
jgi:hypothetical protein